MKRLLVILAILVCSPIAKAAIAHDSASSSSGNAATSLTWSHTVVSNTNGIIVVGCSMDDPTLADRTISGITYNTVALTKNSSATSDDNTHGIRVEQWTLKAPATGAHNVVVTFGGTVNGFVCGAEALTGVDQTTPTDATGTPSSGTGATVTTNITTVADNAMIVDTLMYDATVSTITAGTNQTTRWSVNDATDGISGHGSTKSLTPAGATTMTWTITGGSTSWVATATSFKPSTGGGTPAPVKQPQIIITENKLPKQSYGAL